MTTLLGTHPDTNVNLAQPVAPIIRATPDPAPNADQTGRAVVTHPLDPGWGNLIIGGLVLFLAWSWYTGRLKI